MKIELPKEITIGQKYEPAMKITDPKEAQEYLEVCIDHCVRFGGKTREEAGRIEKSNLGYFAGHFDVETMQRGQKLFQCAHPVFGTIEKNGVPTPEEAFAAGLAAGKKSIQK